MKIIYVTLNDNDEARKIAKELLGQNLANCVNFFPITCIYKYDGKVTEEPEVVLIIKTKEGYYERIKKVVKRFVDYDNFIGQIEVENINGDFSRWLNETVK